MPTQTQTHIILKLMNYFFRLTGFVASAVAYSPRPLRTCRIVDTDLVI